MADAVVKVISVLDDTSDIAENDHAFYNVKLEEHIYLMEVKDLIVKELREENHILREMINNHMPNGVIAKVNKYYNIHL